MTRHTNPRTIVPDSRTWIAALVVAMIAFSLLWAGTGAATAQTEQPTVSVSSATTTVDDTTTVEIVLTDAPDGLSGYYFDLTVDNPEVATVTSASYSEEFGLTTDPAIDTDGQTVTLEAADTDGSISPGATDVTLATVEIESQAAGEVELTVEPQQFDSNNGDRFRPETRAGILTIDRDGSNSADAARADAAEAGSDAERNAGSDAGTTSGFDSITVVLVGAALIAIGSLAAVAIARQRS
jgi:hypothetical protein